MTATKTRRLPRGATTSTPAVKDELAELLTRREREFETKRKYQQAVDWTRICLPDSKPIGILWLGDPHVDDDGCNIPLLRKHVNLAVNTPGLFAANIGDTTNNWGGRLARLWADQSTNRTSARRLCKWLLADAGVPWLVWIMGNHDLWDQGADIIRLMDIKKKLITGDWTVKFELKFPNSCRVKVHAAHDFPGSSIWSKTHGPSRAAQLGGTADLYVCGHRHDWGVTSFETPDGRCPVAARVRGYKWYDKYATENGYQQSRNGAAVLTIIDPRADPAGRVMAFPDPMQGARVLRALRSRHHANSPF